MSWGALGNAIGSQFQQGLQDNLKNGAQQQMKNNANPLDPSIAQPAPAPTPAQAMPPPQGGPAVGQSQTLTPVQSPLASFLAQMMMKKYPQGAPGPAGPKGYVSSTPAPAPEGDNF